MTNDALRCTCPTKFDEHSKAIVRANTNQLCPAHGCIDVAGKCKACGASIVQTHIVRRTTMQMANEKQSTLSLETVSAINIERCNAWHPAGIREWSALEWAGAMCGEAGEAANLAKKLKRLDEGLAGKNCGESWKKMDSAKLRLEYSKEIGDVFLYLDLMAQREGLSMYECIRYAFNMTSEKENLPQRMP